MPVMADARLFTTTRGKILVSLCRGPRTVAELAHELSVTDNAIRAQLQRLQRGGLILKSGTRRALRRPHVEYQLTPKARELFPRAYEPVLKNLVDVLTDRRWEKILRECLSEATNRFVRERVGQLRGKRPRQRLAEIMKKLNGSSLGIKIGDEGGKTTIRSC